MEKNVKPKKKIGQHFLSDDNIAKKIIDLVNFKKLCKKFNSYRN